MTWKQRLSCNQGNHLVTWNTSLIVTRGPHTDLETEVVMQPTRCHATHTVSCGRTLPNNHTVTWEQKLPSDRQVTIDPNSYVQTKGILTLTWTQAHTPTQ